MISLREMRRRLQDHDPERLPIKPSTIQSATAVVIRIVDQSPELLFIKRSDKSDDPWSGQMAFPGGKREAVDASLRQAAMRETLEEIGLDLLEVEYLGELSHQRARGGGQVLDMIVAPFVFGIDRTPDFTPSDEVADVVWSSLPAMFHGENYIPEHRVFKNSKSVFNGYHLSNRHFVWGLTYRTLQSLFGVIDTSYVSPLDPSQN